MPISRGKQASLDDDSAIQAAATYYCTRPRPAIVDLADQYGVSDRTMSNAINGRGAYRHLLPRINAIRADAHGEDWAMRQQPTPAPEGDA